MGQTSNSKPSAGEQNHDGADALSEVSQPYTRERKEL